ncbi:unnamed protein product, partial [marine sediment metagenome]
MKLLKIYPSYFIYINCSIVTITTQDNAPSLALEVLKGEARSRSFKKALNNVLKRVLEGETLARSLERHPKIFDKFFQNIVRV